MREALTQVLKQIGFKDYPAILYRENKTEVFVEIDKFYKDFLLNSLNNNAFFVNSIRVNNVFRRAYLLRLYVGDKWCRCLFNIRYGEKMELSLKVLAIDSLENGFESIAV